MFPAAVCVFFGEWAAMAAIFWYLVRWTSGHLKASNRWTVNVGERAAMLAILW